MGESLNFKGDKTMRKQPFKKLAAVLLAVTLLVTMMPAAAFGATYSVFGSGTSTVPVYIEAARADNYAVQILDLVNEQRAAAGLRPLAMDSELQDAAIIRAVESITYFSHTRPDGSSCITVSNALAGENIAVGFGDPALVVEGWMNSSGHRANILNSSYGCVGIACVYYEGNWYWAQSFGRSAGDGKLSEASAMISQTVNVLSGLITPKWNSAAAIDLGTEGETAVHQIQIVSPNPEWSYASVVLDNIMFSFHSSDESVVTVDAFGMMTPVSVGTASITASLIADPSRTVTQEIKVGRTLKAEDIILSKESYTYDGNAKKPAVTVTGVDESQYVVSYKDNVKVGTATVVVTGVGDVVGTAEKTFQIKQNKPDQVTLKTPTTGKSHYVKVKWNEEDCDGYQIRYATNSSFKNSKSIYVKDPETLSKTIKNLKKGKRYYVKVRAYNSYEGTKVYGKWSKWKSIVCK